MSTAFGESLNYKDAELTNILDGQDKAKMKSIEREHRRKVKWLSELITFKRMDMNGNVPKGCEWMVTRKRVTKKFIQDLVNRCPIPCTIDYVYDNHGVAHWFDDLMMTAQTKGFYIIAPQILRSPEDILKDATFQGQTSVFLKFVPNHAVDGRTPVTTDVLKEFIWYSITEIDPRAIEIRKSISRIEDEIAEIAKIMKRIPKQELLDNDGKPLTEEEADEERQIMYEMYGKAKYEVELKLKKRQEDLENHHKWRRTMGLDILQVDIDENTETSTYEVRLFGTSDAKQIEDLLIEKDDYLGIKLACGSIDPDYPFPPWCGRGSVPNGAKPPIPDYTNLVVGISGMRLFRTLHGVGTNKTLDRNSASIKADRFGIYYGDWNIGKKNGAGIQINDTGVFSGRFVNNYIDGYGRLDLANGTTIVGNFGIEQETPKLLHTAGFDNPYRDGEPNGKNIEILFADGGIYQGEMKNGTINGIGVYQSAFGETFAGEFKNGVFDCELGKVTNQWGDVYIGRWENNELNGKGVFEDKKGNSYKGYWKENLKHGRGYETLKNKGEYKGYFINGYKHGKGELNFIKRKKIKSEKKDNKDNKLSFNRIEEQADKISTNYVYKYQGYFQANSIFNGGIIMDTIIQTPSTISRKDTTKSEILAKYKNYVDNQNKKKNREVEKYADLENYIRLEMTTKKYRIFRQQRHYLKKTMYFEDTYGEISPLINDNKLKVRSLKFKNMSNDYLKSSRAIIPRLQLKNINQIQTTHLTKTFDRIELVDSNQEKAYAIDRKNANKGGTDNSKYDPGHVDQELIKNAINDMEEMKERQNMMKYDKMWERAENAYIAKKRVKNKKQGL